MTKTGKARLMKDVFGKLNYIVVSEINARFSGFRRTGKSREAVSGGDHVWTI